MMMMMLEVLWNETWSISVGWSFTGMFDCSLREVFVWEQIAHATGSNDFSIIIDPSDWNVLNWRHWIEQPRSIQHSASHHYSLSGIFNQVQVMIVVVSFPSKSSRVSKQTRNLTKLPPQPHFTSSPLPLITAQSAPRNNPASEPAQWRVEGRIVC